MRFRALALLLASFLLVLPAAALAQSAGDDQYSDPFAEGSPPSGGGDSSAPGGGGSGNHELAQTPNSGSGGNGDGTAPSSTSQSSPRSPGDGSLPRTGLSAWMLAVMGGLMLLAGAMLRLGIQPLRARAGGTPTLGRDVLLTRRLR